MTRQALEPQTLIDLRIKAAGRLNGPAAVSGVAAKAADALVVLHALASSPDTAADALALLHELQVHQVELDLQAEELRDSRADLEAALRRQMEVYDHQPVSCFSVDAQLVIRDANLRGAALLGVPREAAAGLALDTLLTPEGARALQHLMSEGAGTGGSGCMLALHKPEDRAWVVRAEVGPDPAGGFFVVLMNATTAQASTDM